MIFFDIEARREKKFSNYSFRFKRNFTFVKKKVFEKENNFEGKVRGKKKWNGRKFPP